MKINNYAIKSWLVTGLTFGAVLMASAVSVTFQINMSVQTALGQFDATAGDYVVVGGDFNSWSTSAFVLTQTSTNADVWQGTVDLTASSYPNYKFIMIRSSQTPTTVWEIDGLGSGGAQNRWFGVGTSDQVLSVVYFNNINTVPSNVANVTFQVNMSVQTAAGVFDPVNGPLVVAGSFNNWDTTSWQLAPSLANTNIWVGTFAITNNVGTPETFKYVMNGGTWETSANRMFAMTNIDQTLAVVYFNNESSLPTDIPLTFSVNMGVQEALGNFNPGNGDYVEARGSFLTSGTTWIGGFTLTNDPVNSPLIFTGTYVDPNDAPGGTVTYNFVINGSTWEGNNRSFILASTNAVTQPLAYYNNVNNLGPIYLSQSGSQTALTWPAGTNVNSSIRVQSSTNLLHGWLDVPNTQGQSSITNNFGPKSVFFRLVGP